MTRDETKGMIREIMSLYPNWKPENLTATVDAWHEQLKDVDFKEAKSLLSDHVKSSKGSFPPNVSALIPKQPETYGFTGRHYPKEFYDELEKIALGR